jgi:hypothetical protein
MLQIPRALRCGAMILIIGLLVGGPLAARPLGVNWPCLALGQPEAPPAHSAQGALLGPITREQIEDSTPAWVQSLTEAHPDAATASELLKVEPGAAVTVYLGTWCSDSRREVSRLWRALDEAAANGETLPFELSYVGIDEQKKEPAAAVKESGLRFLPTIIVRRNGQEQGRIVESSPHGVEADLLALLTGRASGLLTLNRELAPPSPPPPPPGRR